MDGSMSRGRRLQFLAVALVILLLPFGWYWFSYVSFRQVNLTDRNFRLLGVTSQQIQARIEYLHLSWVQMTSEAETACQEQGKNDRKECIKRKISLISGIEKNDVKVEDQTAKEIEEKKGLSFKLERARNAVNLNLEDKRSDVRVTAKTDLGALLTPIVNRPEFDDVLVVRPKGGGQDEGEVLFQRAPSGVQILTWPLRPEKKATNEKGDKGANEVSQANRLLEITLAGARYQVFVQPLHLSFDEKKDEGQWLVCGLVRYDRFLSESLSIPQPVLLSFLFLILTVALTWPFLNLWFMGPRERLAVSDVFFLGLSILVGSALFTLVLLDVYAYLHLATKLDQRLAAFADTIRENFYEELFKIDRQLATIQSERVAVKQQEEGRDVLETTSLLRTEILAESLLIDYPYFDSVFWIDNKGEQRSKWTVQTQTTPLINVYDRDYFRSIFQCWSWVRPREGRNVHFYVDPVYSWNTGENLTVYSVPIQEFSDANLPCPSASDDGSVKLAVAALVTRPLSLIRPVVPPGFGYAIITDEGSVLFHVDDTRNLRENLFEETTHNKFLRAAVFGHSAEWLDAEYGGKPHRLYVRPLDNLPWFLVVYRDKELLTTANLELLSVVLILVIFYFLFLLLIVLPILYLWTSEDRLRWLWPTPERTRIYWFFAGLNLLLSLGLCLWLDRMTERPAYLLGVTALAPILEVVFIYFILWRKGLTSDLWKRDSAGFRLGYVFAVASIFLPLSIFPVLTFFKVAHDDEMMLVAKHGQLQIARAIEARARRIKDQYFSVQIDEKEQFLAKRLELQCGWCYPETALIKSVTDKQLLDSITWTLLPKNPLDIYTTFFFDTWVFSSAPRKETNQIKGSEFEGVLSQIRPLYSEASVELYGVRGPGSANRLGPELTDPLSWGWERIGFRREQLKLKKEQTEENRSLLLVSTMPVFEWPTGVVEWGGVSLGSVLLLVFLYGSVHVIARRVFLRDFLEPPNPGQTALKELSRNVLLLGPPFSGKSELLHKQEGFCVVDLHKQWKKTVTYQDVEQEAHKVIALDHFECQLGVPEQDYAKLQLLEDLLFTYKKPVVIASTIDPVEFYCGSPAGRDGGASMASAREQDKDAWAGIFSSFWNVYVGDEGDPEAFAEELSRQKTKIVSGHTDGSASQRADKRLSKLFRLVESECRPTAYLQEVGKKIVQGPTFAYSTLKELKETIWDQACVYYQVVWSTCSVSEQVLLIRLAQDRFVNARNPDLPRLLKRRLIVRDPNLRLMNASFVRFVGSITPSREVLSLEEKAKTGGWNALKAPLLVVLTGVGFFLYTTQPDLFNTTTAFASAAAAGGMPALFKLFAALVQEDKAKQS
ncbi:MAG: cache domain-containing protein [Candidatus Binatia bacterium]